MRNNNFFKTLLLLVSVLLFASCDKDYNEIGDALIGENHFNLDKNTEQTVHAYTYKIGAISSSNPTAANMPINALGVLDNKVFGKTTANFVTQAELASVNPTIDPALGQTVQSVTLYIPYFTNKNVTTNSDGTHIYTLDSIYGTKNAKLKLNIYENKHVLDNLNTEPGAPLVDPAYPQLYYTNQDAEFNNEKGALLVNDNEFVFSPNEYTVTNADATKTYTAPGMKLDLNKTFFQNLILSGKLTANDVFKEYFKGLYFSVEKAGTEGVLAMMNFKKGTIVINYKEKTSSTDGTLVDKSITLNLTGNTVNLLTNDFSSSGIEYNSNPNPERLYLRGGEGSVALIDLFGTKDDVKYNRTTKKIETGTNNIPDELDYIKEKGWLINEASLTFYIDQAAMSGVDEPNRIFLYDVNNRVPVLDYHYDGTTSASPNYAKQVFGGIIEKDANGRGLKYKIRITNYLRDLLNNDRSNVKLGVSVSQAISNINFSKQYSAPLYDVWKGLDPIGKNAYYFPEASVMNPLGTILYGSNASDPEKRLKLEIYYTKPN